MAEVVPRRKQNEAERSRAEQSRAERPRSPARGARGPSRGTHTRNRAPRIPTVRPTARGVGPRHAARIRNEYKYIERSERQKEKETLRRRGGFRARIGKVGELHAPTRLSHARSHARTLARSSFLARGRYSLAGPGLVPSRPASRRHGGPLSPRVCSVSARPQHAPCR